jgi:hypothetical protein
MAEFKLDIPNFLLFEEISSDEESNNSITKPSNYHGQIYKITNLSTGKVYIGQTVSHVVNRGKYIGYGYLMRWKKHISDSRDPNKRKQCTALNRAIRSHGEHDFKIDLIDTCEHVGNSLNDLEINYIAENDCIAPKGYNLTAGGEKHAILDWQKEQISETLKQYYSSDENKKKHSKDHWEKNDQRTINRYKNVNITWINLQVKKTATETKIFVTTFINEDEFDKFQVCGKRLTNQELFDRMKNIVYSAFKNIKVSSNNLELQNHIVNNQKVISEIVDCGNSLKL